MSQQYDALSRMTSENITRDTVPDNEIVTYAYNNAGWLQSVNGYIDDIQYNARGQKTQLVYANNVRTDWTFDPDNFRVTRRVTSSNTSPPARIALTGWANSWVTTQPPTPPSGFMNLYRGEICVSDQTDACLGGDATIDTGNGPQIGYVKSSGGTGTVPVYQSTRYVNSSGATVGWGLSLDANGSPVGYLSTTAPDGPSGSSPFVQSNGLLLQGISGTPSAYLWSPQSSVVVQDDHIYNNGGSAPTDYTASGLVGYLELDTATGNVALRRYVNTTTGHHYYSTANDPPSGFVTDGILGYLRTAADSATVTVYRHYSAATGDYVLTTSSTPPTGYALQATLGYLYTTPTYDSGDHQDLAYHYDQVGNITAVVDNIFTASRIYTYDALNRLETAYGYFGQDQMEKYCTYDYNSIGNILNKCGVTFTYGDTNHPSAVTSTSSGKNYSYDPNGNMATGGGRDFAWNIDNRVNSVSIGGSTTSMEYDYTGMRVKKDGAGGQTLYPFAGYEIDANGTTTKFIRIGGENFASKKRTTSGVITQLFYHNDHLGGVNVVTDNLGGRVQLNEYDPWGGISRSEGTIDPDTRFTGQKLDAETGLYYYGGRYYDAEISRFISPDPFVPRPGNPQSLNRYSYTLNNPVRYIDPSGYFYISKNTPNFWQSFGGIFAGIVVSIITGGAGAPAIVAGAIGGATAGAINTAMNGGNAFLNVAGGALLGGVAGGIFGPLSSGLGGGFAAAVGAGAITGAVTGAMSTPIFGGNFGRNLGFGALSGAGMAALFGIGNDLGDSTSNSGTQEHASEPFVRVAQLQKYAVDPTGETMSDAYEVPQEAQMLPFPIGPKAYGGGTGQFIGATFGWYFGARFGASIGLATLGAVLAPALASAGGQVGAVAGMMAGAGVGPLGILLGGTIGYTLGASVGASIGLGIGGGVGGLIGGFGGAALFGSVGHYLFDSPGTGVAY